MKRFIILFIFLTNTFTAQARVDCPVATISNIQIEGTKIMYLQQGAPWRTLGFVAEAGTKERYSAILAAQMSAKPISVAYRRADYDCTKTNYGEAAYIVRTYNK